MPVVPQAFLVAPALPVQPAHAAACRRRRRRAPTAHPTCCASVTKRTATRADATVLTTPLAPQPTTTTKTTTPAPAAPPPVATPPTPPQYRVRAAARHELYVVADIRCEAFYDSPHDARYHPVRRREIYQAMQARVASGTHCVVAVDRTPPTHWRGAICVGDDEEEEEDGLVVGSLDVSLHRTDTGARRAFELPPPDAPVLAYVSSMAVRPLWKRRGLARRLLDFTDSTLVRMGLSEVFLHVDADNEPALRLYETCGFRVVRAPVPQWVHELAKEEHTLMVKRLPARR